jgi:hypothetical protein
MTRMGKIIMGLPSYDDVATKISIRRRCIISLRKGTFGSPICTIPRKNPLVYSFIFMIYHIHSIYIYLVVYSIATFIDLITCIYRAAARCSQMHVNT